MYLSLISWHYPFKYYVMEKEFLALSIALFNLKDFNETSITFVITDLQSILWAFKVNKSNLKIARWV